MSVIGVSSNGVSAGPSAVAPLQVAAVTTVPVPEYTNDSLAKFGASGELDQVSTPYAVSTLSLTDPTIARSVRADLLRRERSEHQTTTMATVAVVMSALSAAGVIVTGSWLGFGKNRRSRQPVHVSLRN